MIRPVDLPSMLPSSTEVARTEHGQLQRHGNDQAQFAQQLDKKAAEEKKQVQEMNKSEDNNPVDKDGSGQNAYQRKNRRKKEKKEDAPKTKSSASTSLFDIKI